MSETVNTCVTYGYIKVYYDYNKSEPLKSLNPMGNFYRSSHLHKKTQRFMENYLALGKILNIGDTVISGTLFSNLIITNILYNYKKTEGELWIEWLEDKLKKNSWNKR